jgi:hypothetical protein
MTLGEAIAPGMRDVSVSPFCVKDRPPFGILMAHGSPPEAFKKFIVAGFTFNLYVHTSANFRLADPKE